MTDIFTHIDQISPEWLTDCLCAGGALPHGRVVALSGREQARGLSVVGYITVQYSDDAPPTAPRQLFLKTGSSDDPDNEDWLAEVDFYTRLAPVSASVIIPCYHAAYAPTPARFHVLLADFAATHTRIPWPLPPTSLQFGQAVDCLADLHLLWWNHPHFTIAHQDAHAYNFLFPTDPTTQTTRLVDWATWDVEVGARDLAYLIALHCFPEQRARIEQPLMQRYHDRLLAGGVRDYSWEQLWADYRLFVIWNMFVPIEQFYWNVPASIWWYHAERSVLAFDDLQCAELLA